MGIDHSAVGRSFGPFRARVDGDRLIAFAHAIGETRAEYLNATAAKASGWRDIPAPPTIGFSLQFFDNDDPARFLEDIGADLWRVLHVDQSFDYLAPICASDEITLVLTIVGIETKKGGALTFVHDEIAATNQRGEKVARIRRTNVVRNT